MSTEHWYDDHTNVAALIRHQAEIHGHTDFTPLNAADIVEKPWHFDEEWAAYQVAFAAECAEDVKRMKRGGAR